jgi:glycosyltransferase involved in cell wall biosynthesis
LRVLHLTSNDALAGGAKALARLSNGLWEAGHESLIFVGARGFRDSHRVSMPESAATRILDRAAGGIGEALGLQGFIRPGFISSVGAINRMRPDILHIHWTYGRRGIPLLALPRLTRDYPTVWTFHDMWALTGGCTNPRDCTRWLTECAECRLAGIERTVTPRFQTFGRHATLAFRWRRRLFDRSQFVIVTPSRWMASQAGRSPLLRGKQIRCIPNGLDLCVFAPMDKRSARAALGVEPDGFMVLYVGKPDSVGAYSDRIPVFVDCLRRVAARRSVDDQDVRVLLVGGQADSLARQLPFPVHILGAISDDSRMSLAYAASDVLLTPTQYDNYPGIVQESLACGRPVVGSRVGGVPELVEDGVTGWLCERTDPDGFALALEEAMRQPREARVRGEAARRLAEAQYDLRDIVPRISDIYAETVSGHRGALKS